jgi:hypothetical protein
MADDGLYMYAIARDLDPADLAGVTGLSGGGVEVVEHRGLSAVVSRVDLDEYGEDGLRANLEHLDWLETTARTHDAVIQAVSEHGPTAPLRLATICLDEAGVRKRLDEWFHALVQVLDRVEGRREWSLKVIAPPAPAPDLAPAPTGGLSGADYLKRKRTQTETRATHQQDAVAAAEAVHDQLTRHAVAGRLLAAQDPRLSGHQGTMLINAAYLVEADEGAAFEAEAARAVDAHPDLEIDVRGPWPPYSFAMLEQR